MSKVFSKLAPSESERIQIRENSRINREILSQRQQEAFPNLTDLKRTQKLTNSSEIVGSQARADRQAFRYSQLEARERNNLASLSASPVYFLSLFLFFFRFPYTLGTQLFYPFSPRLVRFGIFIRERDRDRERARERERERVRK